MPTFPAHMAAAAVTPPTDLVYHEAAAIASTGKVDHTARLLLL